MIGIELGGNFLKIDQRSSIRLEKNFPILFQDLYQGDFTFPFTVDAEANYKYLGFANIPEASNKVLRFDCFIYLFGMPYQKAILIIKKTTRYKFQCNLVGGIKTLKTASKNLPEINFGDPTYLGKYPEEIAAKATVISKDTDWTHFGYTFVPHKNENFYDGGNPEWEHTLNMVDPNTGDIYYNTLATGNKYALVPFFYLHFILQKIFDEEGLTPTGTFWNLPEMKKILVYNNKSLDSLNEIGGTKIRLQANRSYNQSYFNSYSLVSHYLARTKIDMIKGPAGTYDEPMAYNNALFEYEITQIGLYTFNIEAVARLFVTNMSLGIFVDDKWIGGLNEQGTDSAGYFPPLFSVSYSATMADIGKKAYLGFYRTYYPYTGDPILSSTYPFATIDAGSTVTVTQTNEDNLNLYSRYVYPAKHMKNMTVEGFLLAVKQLGLEFNFDYTTNTVSLDFITDKIRDSEAKDWTNKTVPDFELDLDNYNKGFLVGYDFGTTDQLTIDNFKTVDLNNNIEDFMTLADLPTISSAGQTAFVKNMNQYYISVFDQYATPQYFWKKYTDFYYKTKYANGETEVKLGFSPMLMGMGRNIDPGANVTLETALMPEIKCPGSSDMFGIGDNDFDLKFCFLRGENMVGAAPNNKGGNYMFASSTIFGLNGHLVGEYDFTQHLKSGFNQRYINWIYDMIANGQIVEQDFRLTPLDILTLSNTMKISVDGVIYLLKTITIIAQQNLKLSRAKMLKL